MRPGRGRFVAADVHPASEAARAVYDDVGTGADKYW
jgi:hypothetical protein